jgi:hypothetical protein
VINNKIKIIQADPPNFKLAFKVKESIGVCIINPRGVLKTSKQQKKIILCA